MRNIGFYNETYTTLQTISVPIVDSFVAPPNKVGSGSGEARLYIASQSSSTTESFFSFSKDFLIPKGNNTYYGCPYKCFLSKENLNQYLSYSRNYYINPTQTHRRNISLLYNERLNKVSSSSEFIRFNIYNQDGNEDMFRFYIGSRDNAWDLIREISIPNLTHLNIHKMRSDVNEYEIIYYFELIFDNTQGLPFEIPYKKPTIAETIVQSIDNDMTLDETIKDALIKARKGQGKFRTNTLSIMHACPFTNITNMRLLRASHIIPWAECLTAQDRLDGNNGLTFTPTYDTLFDLGYISFQDDGTLLISPLMTNEDSEALMLIKDKKYQINNENGQRNKYLSYHRKNIFKG